MHFLPECNTTLQHWRITAWQQVCQGRKCGQDRFNPVMSKLFFYEGVVLREDVVERDLGVVVARLVQAQEK